ncbi:MAG: hypothetical protein JWQ19_1900 [Subtercola sp.]|nr:hypothetical protein [Subtercola sp.]
MPARSWEHPPPLEQAQMLPTARLRSQGGDHDASGAQSLQPARQRRRRRGGPEPRVDVTGTSHQSELARWRTSRQHRSLRGQPTRRPHPSSAALRAQHSAAPDEINGTRRPRSSRSVSVAANTQARESSRNARRSGGGAPINTYQALPAVRGVDRGKRLVPRCVGWAPSQLEPRFPTQWLFGGQKESDWKLF